MVRVVDVEKILKISKYKGNGSFRIKIIDNQCAWNNAVFSLQIEKDKCAQLNKINEDNTDYDVSMDISTFSALICGVYESVEACKSVDLEIKSANLDYSILFYKKPNIVTDLF